MFCWLIADPANLLSDHVKLPDTYGTLCVKRRFVESHEHTKTPESICNNWNGGRTGLMVRASDSGSGDPGSILGRVGVFVSLSKRHLLPKSTGNTQE